MEKFIGRPRHIEFQVLGDLQGNVMHLGERECSIQRRHQKLVEESPSPAMTSELRERIGTQVVEALKRIGYSNAGTVEFLMDEQRNLYFIEMNTRIQVEHPVTEMVTGIDLVKSQILLAAGESLASVVNVEAAPGSVSAREPATRLVSAHMEMRGHSMECRINAEDPETFTPSAGRVTAFHPPGGLGVRVDTAAHSDVLIPPYYDSLIAKLITRGKDRAEALARMSRALEMFTIDGIKTSIPLHRKIVADADFRAGNFDTHFLEEAERFK